jgi:hypothetical protein
MRRLSFALLVSALFSCSSSSDPAGVGGSGGSAGQTACWEVDTSCPSSPPYAGAHCEVSEPCSYPSNPYEYRCEAGRWGALCVGAGGGSSCVPPFGESCDSPSSKPISGVGLEIASGDPSTPFTPLADGAPLEVIWGGQGSPMIAYRVRVSGGDVPACALLAHKVALGPYAGAETKTAVRLHCGESLVVYDILPLDQACPNPPVPTEVTLDISAFGQNKSLKLDWANAACPKGGGFG